MKKTIPLYRMSFVQFTQILYFIFIGLRIAESLYIFYNIKSYENDYMPRFLQRLTACLHLFEYCGHVRAQANTCSRLLSAAAKECGQFRQPVTVPVELQG